MREKELRLALVCYGGISLAVYMHGITKEIWYLARASRNFHAGEPSQRPSEAVYGKLLQHVAERCDIKLRVLPDIIAGASAGGINGVFLAQAVMSGQSLEPLTRLWLDCADIDVLLDPDARPFSRFTKIWAQPIVWFALSRPGGTLEKTVAKETRNEVKTKLSRLVRARWFAPPFSGVGFSRLICDALNSMASSETGKPLLPVRQPLDLYVTVTDFYGHLEQLRLHSPAEVLETEHRLSIGFRAVRSRNNRLADPAELTFAARATASFPGAFPPFNVSELDAMLARRNVEWPGRDEFLSRIFPRQPGTTDAENAMLIDGSVLTNAPFEHAIDALKNRPAQREVDRRFVYIDPTPDFEGSEITDMDHTTGKRNVPGFFSTIFGALSNIPREQPIRDSLDGIERRTQRVLRMRQITESLREEVEHTVADLFGRTFFFDRPTPKRLANWRNKAQQKAALMAGYTYAGYGQLKLAGIVEDLSFLLRRAVNAPEAMFQTRVRDAIWRHLASQGIESPSDPKGGATEKAIDIFRTHDLGFRIRRLRLLARRLNQDIVQSGSAPEQAVMAMHDTIYDCLSLYVEREMPDFFSEGFETVAAHAERDAAAAMEIIASQRDLRGVDAVVDEKLAEALALLPKEQRRSMLLIYLGFPFYDIATLPLLQGEGLNEFDPIKVDRISPDDAISIRTGGANATLRGIEFNSFGAFFSRTYRENDYLWGRLHGAERMIDLVASTVSGENPLEEETVRIFKRDIFFAILEEEEDRLTKDPSLIPTIRREVEEMLG